MLTNDKNNTPKHLNMSKYEKRLKMIGYNKLPRILGSTHSLPNTNIVKEDVRNEIGNKWKYNLRKHM